jgi:SSS family solute:Na+ symporter/sodium/proline symporter
MVGAAVTPALLAAFLWKRVTPTGGMISIALGIATTILFGALATGGVESLNLGLFRLPLDYDYIIYPAATASILGLIVGSLLTRPSPESIWRQFVSNH